MQTTHKIETEAIKAANNKLSKANGPLFGKLKNGGSCYESSGNEKGKVVVQIEIDQYGNVISANPGAEGTTLMDKGLWNEARVAAMKTHFNTSASSPTTQSGIITYTF